jgi:hypothetical protein
MMTEMPKLDRLRHEAGHDIGKLADITLAEAEIRRDERARIVADLRARSNRSITIDGARQLRVIADIIEREGA